MYSSQTWHYSQCNTIAEIRCTCPQGFLPHPVFTIPSSEADLCLSLPGSMLKMSAAYNPRLSILALQIFGRLLFSWVMSCQASATICCVTACAHENSGANLSKSLTPCLISPCWVSDTGLDLAQTNTRSACKLHLWFASVTNVAGTH